MKKTAALFAVVLGLLGQPNLLAQGTLTPPGSPAPSQKSLQELWEKLEALSQKVETLTPLLQQALPAAPGMVTVQGGTLRTSNSLNGTAVPTFQIGKYEVRWDEWQEVRTWALSNGYGNFTTGNGSAADHPVRNVNWYDSLKYCNARSEREGLVAVYSVNGTVYRTGESIPTVNNSANGYRLPTDAEWEYAARGGVLSQGFLYAGSGILTHVGWYYDNSSGAAVNFYNGRGTWPVGQKAANELGIYDMSGNMWEWCWDASGSDRRVRGGGWDASAGSAAVAERVYDNAPGYKDNGNGFRIARNSAP
jgi:sulfatase modifying factor 1